MDNPSFRLIVADAETIATRTDPWDPGTEVSRSACDAVALAAEQAEVVARAQVRLDELIGLDGRKEQIAVWRTEIQIGQLLAALGELAKTDPTLLVVNTDDMARARLIHRPLGSEVNPCVGRLVETEDPYGG